MFINFCNHTNHHPDQDWVTNKLKELEEQNAHLREQNIYCNHQVVTNVTNIIVITITIHRWSFSECDWRSCKSLGRPRPAGGRASPR